MPQPRTTSRLSPRGPSICSSALFSAALFSAFPLLTGCIAVGYSSRGGWFLWPGGLGLLVLVVLFALMLRRR